MAKPERGNLADPALTAPSRAEIEDFLYGESELLDRHEYSAWLELFAPDGVYWVPAGAEGDDPAHDVSIVYDDRERLAERVWRLESGLAHAQEPRSRVSHLVGNVRILGTDGENLEVATAFTVTEWRLGVQRTHAGRCTYRLRREGTRWVIAMKKVELVNRDAHIGSLGIIL